MELDDIRQLIIGNDNLNLKQIFFDASHPVDSTYVQYPQQKSPEDVFNKDGVTSTWQVINYSGAFFRAEGGNAATFIKETDSLIKQSQATRKNGLSVSKSGNAYKTGSCYGNSQSISGGGHSHSYIYFRPLATEIIPMPSFQGGPGYNYDYPSATTEGGEHTHTFTPSITDNIGVTDNISVSMSDGDIETRPENYTIKIWKRTA